MNTPVVSGGVFLLIAVLLCLLYLLPSWRGRHQAEAAELNAVRLNRALRVLAETAETPEPVRVELSTRAAYEKQREAKRLQKAQERRERLAAEDAARAELDPAVVRAYIRQRVRLGATVVMFTGIGVVIVATGFAIASIPAWSLAIPGLVAIVIGAAVLQRMAAVARAEYRRANPPVVTAQVVRQRAAARAELFDRREYGWVPREVPEQLVAQRGTRAHAHYEAGQARESLIAAARAEALEERARLLAGPQPTQLPQRATKPAPQPAAVSESVAKAALARMGQVDDAEIEAGVRQLLRARQAS